MSEKLPRLLIVHCDNPGTVTRAFGESSCFAHPRAYGAITRRDGVYESSDFDYLTYAEKWDSPIPVRRFVLTGQLDEKQTQPYGVRYGYQPEDSDMVTARDMRECGKGIEAIERGMRKLDDVDGPVSSHGHLIARLARVLRVDSLVLMRPRPWVGDNARVHLTFAPAKFGEAIWYVNQQCAKAHDACRKACGLETV
jgi:hypothetical protein